MDFRVQVSKNVQLNFLFLNFTFSVSPDKKEASSPPSTRRTTSGDKSTVAAASNANLNHSMSSNSTNSKHPKSTLPGDLLDEDSKSTISAHSSPLAPETHEPPKPKILKVSFFNYLHSLQFFVSLLWCNFNSSNIQIVEK